MSEEKKNERSRIISELKELDIFFTKVNFDPYSLEDLKNFKAQCDKIATSFKKQPGSQHE